MCARAALCHGMWPDTIPASTPGWSIGQDHGMPDWASALLGAAIGAGAALAGTLLQLREARRQREDVRRETGAALLGRILSLLRECEPTQSGPRVATMNDLRWRWGELRLALDVFAAGHPSDTIGERRDAVIRSVETLLDALDRLVAQPSDGPLLEEARGAHSRALDLTRELLTAVRT